MKFSTTTLATILVALAAVDTSNASSSSVSSIRGVASTQQHDDKAAWSTTHFGTTHTHRHLEQGNADCLLVERDTQFEDHEDHQERDGLSRVWVCEFPFAVAQSRLKGRAFIDIDTDDVPMALIDSMDAQSGVSILKTTGAYIEERLDTGEMKMRIPTTASMEIVSIDSDEHGSQHKRRLASPNPGSLSVLVVKVIDSVGAQIDATNAQLYNDIFDDEYSLKTGYESCSKEQLIMEPAADRNDGESGVVDGITSVVLDIEAQEDNNGNLRDAAVAKATEEYGDISSQYDLVMLCLPRTSSFVAYAYINSWLSVYNDYWCQRVSAQMHEIGHNLGFAHSNQNGESYKDQSGMMGYSYNQDDGPKMCFNAPKNFQTGWYTNAQESFYPLENKNSMVERTLIGITDYQVSGNNNGNLVTLRLGDDENNASNSNGDDYYVGFNLKDGINEGTLEGADQVIVFRKQAGGPTQYGESDRIADLNAGDSYTIQGFKGTSFDVTIRVKPFENNDRTAPIEITTGVVGPQTLAPVPSPTPVPNTTGPTPQTPAPVPSPTMSPSESPTINPTTSPTSSPSSSPTTPPTTSPTTSPSESPTINPTTSFTSLPSSSPTMPPTTSPTTSPSESPTINPTTSLTSSPTSCSSLLDEKKEEITALKKKISDLEAELLKKTSMPSYAPSSTPSYIPSALPTNAPTTTPITSPSPGPTPASPTSTGCKKKGSSKNGVHNSTCTKKCIGTKPQWYKWPCKRDLCEGSECFFF